MIELKDEDLIFRLRNFEDSFVERKTAADSKDWCKTVVAFANTTPIGYPAVLYIGVTNAGEIEAGVNLDTLQKTLDDKLKPIYPKVYYLPKVLKENGKQFLAVIVPGSNERPHFSAPAYVRKGSKTVEASEAQFAALIAERQSKLYEVRKWIGKSILLERRSRASWGGLHSQPSNVKLLDCGPFYVTCVPEGGDNPGSFSIPLSRIDVSFNHSSQCLTLEVNDHD